MAGQVTALGLRNGDPAVLRALLDRRGAAVLAYCEWICAPSDAVAATADAFARFRTIVMNTARPGDIDPEAALLAATRRASAERTPADGEIEGLADLLVGRAEGVLDRRSAKLLHELLDASPAARATEDRFNAAEHAYRTAVGRPVPDTIARRALDAMLGVDREAETSQVLEHAMAVAAVAEAGDRAVPETPEVEDPDEGIVEPPAEEPDPEPDLQPDDPEPEPEEPVAEEPVAEEPVAEEPLDEEPEEEAPEEEAPEDEEPEDEEPEDETEEPVASDTTASYVAPAIHAHPSPPAHSMPTATPALPRPRLPGRSALAPAAAVVVIATIGAMVASGVFGGNDSSPPLDTGIVPTRALNTIPEGEAGSVISDLRGAADKARQQRLADKRAAGIIVPPATTTTTPSAPETSSNDEQSAPADTGTTAEDATGDATVEETPEGHTGGAQATTP